MCLGSQLGTALGAAHPLCVVYMATGPSNLERSTTWEVWKAVLSDPAATEA